MPPKQRKKNKKQKKQTGDKKCPTSPTKSDFTLETIDEGIDNPNQSSNLPTTSGLSAKTSTTSENIIQIVSPPVLFSELSATNKIDNNSAAESIICIDNTSTAISHLSPSPKLLTENIASAEASTSTKPTVNKDNNADLSSKLSIESAVIGNVSTCSEQSVDITYFDGITSSGTLVKKDIDPIIYAKFITVKSKVPHIFLHKPTDIDQHIQALFALGIKFKCPYMNIYYTKIKCLTYEDKKKLTQYLEKKKLPYHTYSDPFKRKMKVVIRGFPNDIDLGEIKSDLKSIDIPVLRCNKMQVKMLKKENDNTCLVLAVVPYTDDGIKILGAERILGHQITLEPPKRKSKQCHRCQLWGHTQRHCHGQVKCVKCAGDHFSKKCQRDSDIEPPKCANCGGKHTANYRQCSCCPDSNRHKLTQKIKHNRRAVLYRRKNFVTWENCNNLKVKPERTRKVINEKKFLKTES